MKNIITYKNLKARIARTLVVGLFAFVAVLGFGAGQAHAYSAGNVMSDYVFRSYNSMSEAQIQAFLVSRGSFLASFVTPDAKTVGPSGEVIGAGTSAAHVIWLSAQWNQVNPQVIMATMQKEQSSITSPTQTIRGMTDCAMGYENGHGCDWMYANQPGRMGLAPQVVYGAWQLRFDYERAWGNSAFEPGYQFYGCAVATVCNVSGTQVLIANGTTAALYNYTPFVYTYAPSGNFRINFSAWFGDPDSNGLMNVYRFWNKNGTHFYTASEAEKNTVIAKYGSTYRLEGVAYQINPANPANSAPLYRFYNRSNGTHFYTASEAEKNNVIRTLGYKYSLDGVAYYVAGGGTPVHRFWNKNGTHFYTASEAERVNVIQKYGYQYTYEGIAFFIQ
jgi:hypothetical protein